MISIRRCLIVAVLVAALASSASAWRPGGIELVGAPARPTDSGMLVVNGDGDGGLEAFWLDGRASSASLYAQCVSPSGLRRWTPGGIARISIDPHESAFLTQGPLTTFLVRHASEARFGGHRVLPLRTDGTPRPDWPADGVALGDSIGSYMLVVTESPDAPCPDGGTADCPVELITGLISDPAGSPGEVRIGRWNRSGAHPAWPQGGTLVAEIPGEYDGLLLEPDGDHGTYVVWMTKPADAVPANLFVSRVRNSDGAIAPGWSFGGRVLASGIVSDVHTVPDGSGGLFVIWSEPDAAGSGLAATRAQHLLGGGSLAAGWLPEGRTLLAPGGGDLDAVPDGAGGLFVAWTANFTSTVGPESVFVRRVAGDGSRPSSWPAGDVRLGLGGADSRARLLATPDGGFFAALASPFLVQPEGTLRLQRRTSDGAMTAGWPASGAFVTDESNVREVRVLADGAGGALLAWVQLQLLVQDGLQIRFLAQRIGPDGVLTGQGPPPEMLVAGVRPQPARGVVHFTAQLAEPGPARVEIVDVQGRRVRAFDAGLLGAGAQELSWDGRDDRGRGAPGGVYFVRVRAGDRVVQARIVRVP